jgi:hypothetical protein
MGDACDPSAPGGTGRHPPATSGWTPPWPPCRRGRSTAAEVAAALPCTRRDRRLDELDTFNAMPATLETAAHLDVLVVRGAVSSAEQDGVTTYSI